MRNVSHRENILHFCMPVGSKVGILLQQHTSRYCDSLPEVSTCPHHKYEHGAASDTFLLSPFFIFVVVQEVTEFWTVGIQLQEIFLVWVEVICPNYLPQLISRIFLRTGRDPTLDLDRHNFILTLETNTTKVSSYIQKKRTTQKSLTSSLTNTTTPSAESLTNFSFFFDTNPGRYITCNGKSLEESKNTSSLFSCNSLNCFKNFSSLRWPIFAAILSDLGCCGRRNDCRRIATRGALFVVLCCSFLLLVWPIILSMMKALFFWLEIFSPVFSSAFFNRSFFCTMMRARCRRKFATHP